MPPPKPPPDNLYELPSPHWLKSVLHPPTPPEECSGEILPFPTPHQNLLRPPPKEDQLSL